MSNRKSSLMSYHSLKKLRQGSMNGSIISPSNATMKQMIPLSASIASWRYTSSVSV